MGEEVLVEIDFGIFLLVFCSFEEFFSALLNFLG